MSFWIFYRSLKVYTKNFRRLSLSPSLFLVAILDTYACKVTQPQKEMIYAHWNKGNRVGYAMLFSRTTYVSSECLRAKRHTHRLCKALRLQPAIISVVMRPSCCWCSPPQTRAARTHHQRKTRIGSPFELHFRTLIHLFRSDQQNRRIMNKKSARNRSKDAND